MDTNALRELKGRVEIITVPPKLRERAGGTKLVIMSSYKYPTRYAFVNTSDEVEQHAEAFITALRRKSDEQFIEEILNKKEKNEGTYKQ